MLTKNQVSDYFKVSVATVDRWIVEGRLQAIKLTPGRVGAIRITQEALDAFIANRKEAND